jgi:hypothetical protein
MVQRRDGSGLAREALGELGVGDFDRHGAMQARVVCALDLAHPTSADGGEDFIGAELIA